MTIETIKNILVPKHTKLNESEKKNLFEKHHITSRELPKILIDDYSIAKLSAKEGDVIKIERESKTAGKTFYYRVVING